MSRAVPKQIAELNTLSIPRLEARWRTLFGTESPVRRQGRGSGQGAGNPATARTRPSGGAGDTLLPGRLGPPLARVPGGAQHQRALLRERRPHDRRRHPPGADGGGGEGELTAARSEGLGSGRGFHSHGVHHSFLSKHSLSVRTRLTGRRVLACNSLILAPFGGPDLRTAHPFLGRFGRPKRPFGPLFLCLLRTTANPSTVRESKEITCVFEGPFSGSKTRSWSRTRASSNRLRSLPASH